MNTIFLSVRSRHSSRRRLVTALLAAALLVAVASQVRASEPQKPIADPATQEDSTPRDGLSMRAPLSQFRLPTFNAQGHRSMLIESSEAIVGPNQIELTNLNLTLFDGTAQSAIETILLSPQATALTDEETISGEGPVRIIRDDVEITGIGWRYEHAARKVSIAKNTRIRFQSSLPDLLR
ncbi:hypothetical protein AXK12_06665 [Cephaloticoccus capnophilus]|uniref:LPS export ABC transporter periplasmic protein LptC n=1 Tax=Cephaloticoccus capnophilus TaxID=1548208 RepID=A0A139SK97_9BACT|nr:hypothetical protein [Cephaloticoccus capnophilus]KXU34910.1 hypothetical protein AXK12_06665 [Cephaloticoccus capnophilus]